jgi:membrane-associated phospholipid phosphatase
MKQRWRQVSARTLLTVLVALYFVGLTGYLVVFGGWTTPDISLPGLFVIALVLGRGAVFIADWAPFLGLLLAYESLRSASDGLNKHVDWTMLAHIDRVIGMGQDPVIQLQAWFYRPGIDPLNIAVELGYLGHFVIPVATAYFLWLRDRRGYWEFAGAMLLVSFLGFATFLAFPAAPPWMAAQHGVLPDVSRVIQDTLGRVVEPGVVQTTWEHVGSNEVAPFPSLHAAWPMLVALTLWARMPGSRGRFAPFAYPLVMGFAVVYAGEHYAIDVLGGYAYAFVVWQGLRRGIAWARLRKARPAHVRMAETSQTATDA